MKAWLEHREHPDLADLAERDVSRAQALAVAVSETRERLEHELQDAPVVRPYRAAAAAARRLMRSGLDASALLACLQDEPGADLVADAIAAGSAMSTVNLAEALAVAAMHGAPADDLAVSMTDRGLLGAAITVHPFTQPDAIEAARLRALTCHAGLSLADRACLALATRLSLPVVSADRDWAGAGLEHVELRLIRSSPLAAPQRGAPRRGPGRSGRRGCPRRDGYSLCECDRGARRPVNRDHVEKHRASLDPRQAIGSNHPPFGGHSSRKRRKTVAERIALTIQMMIVAPTADQNPSIVKSLTIQLVT